MSEQRRPFREPLHPAIDEDLIEALVRTFYDRVRAHPDLGPIFASKIGEDWEPHLQKMFAFWSSVTMLTGRYKGQPQRAHMPLKQVTPAHFQTWLQLFRATADEVCGPEIAPIFIEKAERIADSLQLGMFFNPAEVDPARQAH